MAHDDVLRLREEQEAPKKLKGKKKKAPTRLLRDEQRAAQRRAEAEKLVARLEAERAGARRGAREDGLARSGAGRPRRLGRRVLLRGPAPGRVDRPPTGPAGGAGGQGGAGFAVPGASCGGGDSGGDGEGVGEGVGGGNDLGGELGEESVQGLRPGRKNVGLCVTAWGAVRVMVAFCLRLTACTAKAEAIKQWCSLRETK